MAIEMGPVHEEITLVWIAHLARARTLKVPGDVHVLGWVAEPQGERLVASPLQSNWYCKECPSVEEEPPVV